MKKILFIISIIALIASPLMALDLDDDTGGGPGVRGIAKSANSFVNYSGATGAGGYTNGTDGEVMAVVSYSKKADPKQALYFMVRSSMDPDDVDDNGVYQYAPAIDEPDTPETTDEAATGFLIIDPSTETSWTLRGGSSS